MLRSKLSPERFDAIKKLRNEGYSYEKIAYLTGIAQSTVWFNLNDHKLKGTRTWLSKEKIAEIIDLRTRGLSTKKIGPLVGHAPAQVWRVLKRYGMEKPLPPMDMTP